MTIRVRKGGVYDWDVPGPNTGKDASRAQRRLTLGSALVVEPRWDAKGRRQVRLSVGGKPVGVMLRNGTFRVYGCNFPDGRDRRGTWKTFGKGMESLRGML